MLKATAAPTRLVCSEQGESHHALPKTPAQSFAFPEVAKGRCMLSIPSLPPWHGLAWH